MPSTCELCRFTGNMEPYYPSKSILQCPSCGLVFWEGKANADELYTKEYFSGGEYFDYVADKKVIQKNFQARVRDLKALVPQGRLLEIGCAYGFFLEVASRHWKATGIDVAADGVRHARDMLGLDAIQADFLSLPDQLETYDIVCMWDTIEHLPNPVRFIEKASRWLKPGGVLVLTTGDIESRVARLRGEKWRQVHPPTHLYYFSMNTLEKAVRRSGLEPLMDKQIGYYRSSKAMLYGIFALNKNGSRWMYEVLTLRGRLDFPFYLNLYDITMLMARKPMSRSLADA